MRGLGATYTLHHRLIGKLIVDFLFILNEIFALGVTAEALQAKIDRKSAGWSVSAKFSPRRGCPPPIIFARIVKPLNPLQLCR